MRASTGMWTLCLTLAAATPARAAEGTVNLSWSACYGQAGAAEDLEFTGPATVHLVASVQGSDQGNHGHRLGVLVGPNLPDAWRFDAGGCQSGQLAVSHAAVGQGCPAYQGRNSLGLNFFSYDGASRTGFLDVANTYDLFQPSAGATYALWRASFNHAFSVAGDGDPARQCRFAGNPLSFAITRTELLRPDGSSATFTPGPQDEATWNGGPDTELSSSWGRVKGLYR